MRYSLLTPGTRENAWQSEFDTTAGQQRSGLQLIVRRASGDLWCNMKLMIIAHLCSTCACVCGCVWALNVSVKMASRHEHVAFQKWEADRGASSCLQVLLAVIPSLWLALTLPGDAVHTRQEGHH